jgi:hypothetical protein
MALPKITHRFLKRFVDISCYTREPLLITGKPGIGKTVSTLQYAEEHGYDIIISHPVISDPTDFKGFPARTTRQVEAEEDEFAALMDDAAKMSTEEVATFLPFGDLLEAMEATRPTIWFFDDFGQAPMAVQAACMQIIGGRTIGGKRISDHVVIIAATNRREDSAGVKGLLEPVKSRFGAIVELVVDKDEWMMHAYKIGIEQSIIDFINYTPGALEDFKPSKTMENSPNPRLWEKLSDQIKYNDTLPEMMQMHGGVELSFTKALCLSCVGELYGAQYSVFREVYKRLPTYNDILAEPDEYPLDQRLDVRYAMLGMLANQGKKEHADKIFTFVNRLAKEYQAVFVRSIVAMKSELVNSAPCQVWTAQNMDIYQN